MIEFVPAFRSFPDAVWEIFLVVGWVFGWESIDRLCFNVPHLNYQQVKNYRMYHCKFRFTKFKKLQTKVDTAIDLVEVLPSFKKIEDAVVKADNKAQQEIAKQAEQQVVSTDKPQDNAKPSEPVNSSDKKEEKTN